MGALGGILVGVAALALGAYRVMIGLKPAVAPPGIGDTARAEVAALEGRLMDHVRVLASRIGERNLTRPPALRAAAEYIRAIWASQGFVVGEEAFEVGGQRAVNLVAEQKGAARSGAVVLVGAHYDSVVGSPGANNTATGVALLLELSRALGGEALARTVRFVAHVNEEPLHFMTEGMGSLVHARRARRRGDHIVAMLSLETLGYYSSAPGSQRYPFPFGAFYPDTGNFLAVVGNLRSRGLVVDFLRHFMAASDFPVEGVATLRTDPRHSLVRSLGVLGGELPRPHAHGHRALPFSRISWKGRPARTGHRGRVRLGSARNHRGGSLPGCEALTVADNANAPPGCRLPNGRRSWAGRGSLDS